MNENEILEGELNEEYNFFQIEGDDGEVYDFVITDMVEYEDETYAICNLIEGDVITDAYIVYKAIVNDEDKTIDLEELDDDTEDMISNLYYEEFIVDEDDEFEE